MRRIISLSGVVVLVVLGLGLTLGIALGQGPWPGSGYQEVQSESMDDTQRIIYAPAELNASDVGAQISFINTLTPHCYQPDPTQDTCYINFQRHFVNSAPATHMLSMTTTIDSRIRASYRGFFQNTMDVSYNMHSPGFKVACGAPNSSGEPTMGKRYTYQIQAEDSNRAKSANSGSLYCPPFIQ